MYIKRQLKIAKLETMLSLKDKNTKQNENVDLFLSIISVNPNL